MALRLSREVPVGAADRPAVSDDHPCENISRERQGNQRRDKAFTVRHGGSSFGH